MYFKRLISLVCLGATGACSVSNLEMVADGKRDIKFEEIASLKLKDADGTVSDAKKIREKLKQVELLAMLSEDKVLLLSSEANGGEGMSWELNLKDNTLSAVDTIARKDMHDISDMPGMDEFVLNKSKYYWLGGNKYVQYVEHEDAGELAPADVAEPCLYPLNKRKSIRDVWAKIVSPKLDGDGNVAWHTNHNISSCHYQKEQKPRLLYVDAADNMLVHAGKKILVFGSSDTASSPPAVVPDSREVAAKNASDDEKSLVGRRNKVRAVISLLLASKDVMGGGFEIDGYRGFWLYSTAKGYGFILSRYQGANGGELYSVEKIKLNLASKSLYTMWFDMSVKEKGGEKKPIIARSWIDRVKIVELDDGKLKVADVRGVPVLKDLHEE